jgi:hypothetical protein
MPKQISHGEGIGSALIQSGAESVTQIMKPEIF